MVIHRIIPVLLLHKGGLVKTIRFSHPLYVGDPINTVRIFNEKLVDELVIYDIDATVERRCPNVEKIKDIVSEAFMPICYGGGVSSLKEMEKLYRIGVEKISISSSLQKGTEFLKEAIKNFGSQAVIVTLNFRKAFYNSKKSLWTHRGKYKLSQDVDEYIDMLNDLDVGELIIVDMDRDGTMKGYDYDFVKDVVQKARMPVVAVGGAGSIEDLKTVFCKCKVSGAGAGSLFVFYGKKRAVLINYVSEKELQSFFNGGDNEK